MKTGKFPEKLQREIDRSGKSQTRIAAETGIDQSAISAMTRGERRPYADQAFVLARNLGVSVEYLTDDEIEIGDYPGLSEGEAEILRQVKILGLDEAQRRILKAPEQPARPQTDRDWGGDEIPPDAPGRNQNKNHGHNRPKLR